MGVLPTVIFFADVEKDHIAVMEARKMRVASVALVDTNCNPELIDYPIPGNDDAIRSVRLIANRIAEAVIEGQIKRKQNEEAEAALQAELQAVQEEIAGGLDTADTLVFGTVAEVLPDLGGLETAVEAPSNLGEPETAVDAASDLGEPETAVDAASDLGEPETAVDAASDLGEPERFN